MRRFLTILLLLMATSAVLAQPPTLSPMSLPGYTWSSPVTFGEVQELGPDAYVTIYPADVEYEKAQLELVVVHTPRESVAAIREGGANPKTLTLATFLELSGKPEEVNKTLFMGETEARSVYRASTPRPNIVHVYQKYLEDGTLVTVALRDYGGSKPPLVGNVLYGIAETFSRAD